LPGLGIFDLGGSGNSGRVYKRSVIHHGG